MPPTRQARPGNVAALLLALAALWAPPALAGDDATPPPEGQHGALERRDDEDAVGSPWRALAETAAAGAAGFAAVHGAGMLLVSVVALPVLAVSLPGALDANPTACLAVTCLVTPLQLAVVALASLAGAAVAASSSWVVGTLRGNRRVAVPPLLAAIAIPSWAGCATGTGLSVLGVVGSCACATCGTTTCMSFLQDRYDWPATNSEYYAMRRVAPPLFYGCWAVSEVALVTALVGGNAAGALVAGWVVARRSRPLRPGEDALDLEDLSALDPAATVDLPWEDQRPPRPRRWVRDDEN